MKSDLSHIDWRVSCLRGYGFWYNKAVQQISSPFSWKNGLRLCSSTILRSLKWSIEPPVLAFCMVLSTFATFSRKYRIHPTQMKRNKNANTLLVYFFKIRKLKHFLACPCCTRCHVSVYSSARRFIIIRDFPYDPCSRIFSNFALKLFSRYSHISAFRTDTSFFI